MMTLYIPENTYLAASMAIFVIVLVVRAVRWIVSIIMG